MVLYILCEISCYKIYVEVAIKMVLACELPLLWNIKEPFKQDTRNLFLIYQNNTLDLALKIHVLINIIISNSKRTTE